MHMTNCPSEETLAAFIDGRLDIEARQRVVEHVTTCEDCYAIVSFAWDFQAEEPAEAGEGGRGAVARGGGRVVRGRQAGQVQVACRCRHNPPRQPWSPRWPNMKQVPQHQS